MAASSTTVTVLTPNGRRQTVKVSPNTVLLQVLEDVCKKQGFNPEEHGLKFQRTVLDLSLQLRFANLPNNAKLEVVPSTRKQAATDSTIRIALQMEDGSRFQGSFSTGQTLWELLTHFPQTRACELSESESTSTPVCVYMRDEVCGEEALRKTTFKSLGLTGGSAIVRFLLKKSRPLGNEGNGESMETVVMATMPCHQRREASSPPLLRRRDPSPPRPVPLAVPLAVSLAAPLAADDGSREQASPEEEAEQQAPPRQEEAEQQAPPRQEEAEQQAPPRQEEAEQQAPPRQEEEEEEEKYDEQTKCRPIGGKIQEVDGEKAGPSGVRSSYSFTSTASSSLSTSSLFVPFSGGGQRLGGLAGTGAEPSSTSLSSSAAGPPRAKKAKSSHGRQPRKASTTEEEAWDVQQIDNSMEPLDREPLVYHLDSGPRCHSSSQELPDEFFEVTVDDIRKRFAQLKSERRCLEEAPLVTRALREVHMREKIERYPKVVLRIQFPDRHVIQGFFRPLETVADLRHFVKTHLEDPELCFYLFIAPPKTILEDSTATLFQANLFPAALVYFGSDVRRDRYLHRSFLHSSVSALQADKAIAGCVPRSPAATSSCSSLPSEDLLAPSEPPTGARGADQEDPEPLSQDQGPKPVRTDPGKVPKWLKLAGKK